MALTLTVGTNTYISRADAASYFEGRLYSTAWDDAATADQDAALVMATKSIDRLVLRGVKFDTDQALQFPRCYSIASGSENHQPFNGGQHYRTGNYRCDEETPQGVLDAVCEEALALLDRGNASRYKLQADGVESFSVGNLSESYRGGRPQLLSSEAREFMRPYSGAVTIT